MYFYFNPSDAEEDYIAFSSDEELVEALGNMMDDVFRVYIRGKKYACYLLYHYAEKSGMFS